MRLIRFATQDDLPRLVEIYNQAIASGTATADTMPFTVSGRSDWFKKHDVNNCPIYCVEREGQVIGYLAVSPYRERTGLAHTAELSYYIDYRFHGQGMGSELLANAIKDAPRIRKRIFLAIVLEWNAASLRLLEKYQFERWGYLPGVADINGRVGGHFYLGRQV